MSGQNVRCNYDIDNDVLYLSLGQSKPSYGDDLVDGIIARYDMITDDLTGVTILGFKKRVMANDPALKQIPIEFDFDAVI